MVSQLDSSFNSKHQVSKSSHYDDGRQQSSKLNSQAAGRKEFIYSAGYHNANIQGINYPQYGYI